MKIVPRTILVYVRLLGEGTEVYRPATAVLAEGDSAELLTPRDFDPEDEEWEFPPGSLVRIERRMLQDGEVFVAVAASRARR